MGEWVSFLQHLVNIFHEETRLQHTAKHPFTINLKCDACGAQQKKITHKELKAHSYPIFLLIMIMTKSKSKYIPDQHM